MLNMINEYEAVHLMMDRTRIKRQQFFRYDVCIPIVVVYTCLPTTKVPTNYAVLPLPHIISGLEQDINNPSYIYLLTNFSSLAQHLLFFPSLVPSEKREKHRCIITRKTRRTQTVKA